MDLGDIVPLLIIIGIPLLRRGFQKRGNYQRLPKGQKKPKELMTESIKPVDKQFHSSNMMDFQEKRDSKKEKNFKIERAPKLSKITRKRRKLMGDFLDEVAILNGVVMSEVLGPPRAKKPYRPVFKDN
ncbi:MAG: hypothetical protein HPY70_02865 [Firmicutes bacterium]|nr:hypothetical protein [Bacillota bacterium]